MPATVRAITTTATTNVAADAQLMVIPFEELQIGLESPPDGAELT